MIRYVRHSPAILTVCRTLRPPKTSSSPTKEPFPPPSGQLTWLSEKLSVQIVKGPFFISASAPLAPFPFGVSLQRVRIPK